MPEDPTPHAAPARSGCVAFCRAHPWAALALLATLVLLFWHAGVYHFLTDDAYISFRYAVHLSKGEGLVFNPGEERVEGYTNFLWVVLLAAAHRLGIPPEAAAPALTWGLTALLWGMMLWFVLRVLAPGPRWLVPLPLLLLAGTRSVAVWSSSGLETRLFEVLIIGGTLRLIVELQRHRGSLPPLRPLAALLFALGALTRPDGILLAGTAFGTAGLLLALERNRAFWRLAGQAAGMAAIVGTHFLFRKMYYDAWLPNTYYAKVGGQTWLAMGFKYLALFCIEYGVVLWVPLLAAALAHHRSRGTMIVPLMFGAVVLPHAAYIAAIGGDHFEFRPLDLYFPFAFLLLHAGAVRWSRCPKARWLLPAYLGALLLALVWLPWRSHIEFPVKDYVSAFPGERGPSQSGSAFCVSPGFHQRISRFGTVQFPSLQTQVDQARAYLDPGRDLLLRWGGLRCIPEAYQRLMRETTEHFVGIRQEEHRLFLGTVAPEGRRLADRIAAGAMPADAYVAVSAVGAIPFYSDLRTLDRFGLNDRRVAHSTVGATDRTRMAHEKRATMDYARERQVDLWAADEVHLAFSVDDPRLLMQVQHALMRRWQAYTAELGNGVFLLALLPSGESATFGRHPGLALVRLWEPEPLREFDKRVIRLLEGRLAAAPGNVPLAHLTGQWKLFAGDPAGALHLWTPLAASFDDRIPYWLNVSAAREDLGDRAGALAAASRARGLALAGGDEGLAKEILAHITELGGSSPRMK